MSTSGSRILAEAEVDRASNEDEMSEIHDGDCEARYEDSRPEFGALQRPHKLNYSNNYP